MEGGVKNEEKYRTLVKQPNIEREGLKLVMDELKEKLVMKAKMIRYDK